MHYSELKPGREIDVLIDIEILRLLPMDNRREWAGRRWSTDSSATPALIRELAARNLYPGICCPKVDNWICILGQGTRAVEESADTLPMAVCRAALKYVELNP